MPNARRVIARFGRAACPPLASGARQIIGAEHSVGARPSRNCSRCKRTRRHGSTLCPIISRTQQRRTRCETSAISTSPSRRPLSLPKASAATDLNAPVQSHTGLICTLSEIILTDQPAEASRTGGSTGSPGAPLRQSLNGHSAARPMNLWTTGTSAKTCRKGGQFWTPMGGQYSTPIDTCWVTRPCR